MPTSLNETLLGDWKAIHSRLIENTGYPIIAKAYSGKRAKRSDLPYLNHIHEGVYVFVKRFGWQEAAITAFCVHPIFQTDKLLEKTVTGEIDIRDLSSEVIVLAMEYRKVANAYLSTMKVRVKDEITLSPLDAVNQMLVADKVQNKKDYLAKIHKQEDRETFHRASNRYLEYFDSWLDALEVRPEEYEMLESELCAIFSGVA